MTGMRRADGTRSPRDEPGLSALKREPADRCWDAPLLALAVAGAGGRPTPLGHTPILPRTHNPGPLGQAHLRTWHPLRDTHR